MARRQAILATVAAAALLLLLLPHAAHAQDGKGKKHDVTEGGSAYHNGGCGPLPKVVGAGHFDLIGEGDNDTLSSCPKPAEEGDICAADCKKGFLGTIAATCGADGEWTLVGECKKDKLVCCPGLPETGTHAEPFTTNADGGLCVDGEQGDTCVAECEPTFDGEATASCSAAAGWVVTSTCTVAPIPCSGTPTTPGATNPANWFISTTATSCTDVVAGTTCTSTCTDGTFTGTAAATCQGNGEYLITTPCSAPDCPGAPPTGANALPFDPACVNGNIGDPACTAGCQPTFTGSATAVCTGPDKAVAVMGSGKWKVQSTCTAAAVTCTLQCTAAAVTCSGSPTTPGATTAANWVTSSTAPCTGVVTGTMCTSPCGPAGTFTGTAAATCLNTGLYQISTLCNPDMWAKQT